MLSRFAFGIIIAVAMGAASFAQAEEPSPSPDKKSVDIKPSKEEEGPRRPKRGAAPTADRLQRVEVRVNSDGTMTRESKTIADAPGSTSTKPVQPAPTNLPRATVSSTNDPRPTPAGPAPAPPESSTAIWVIIPAVVASLLAVLLFRRKRDVPIDRKPTE